MKYSLMLLIVAMGLFTACGGKGDAKAYEAGCVNGIDEVLGSMGLEPKADAIAEHCKQAAQEYLNPKKK